MPRYDVPKLADYSGAIQANNSMVNAFSSLGNQSQDYLKIEEQKRQNNWSNIFEKQKFDETKNQNAIANKNADREFNYEKTRDDVKDGQWIADYTARQDSTIFDQNYKNKTYDHTVSNDKDNSAYRWAMATKPDYATFNGVDAQGNPTLNMIDKNSGKVVNTGAQVYNEAKRLAPEQSAYYQDRANEMKQKNIDAVQKSLTLHPAWSNLSEEDKVKAYDYVNQNGKLPEFKQDKSTLGFGGGFSLALANQNPINNAQIQPQNIQTNNPSLEEVGKQIDSLGSSTPKYYTGRNSRDLVLAKRWAENPNNQKYIADIWNMTDGTLLERYNQYGRK